MNGVGLVLVTTAISSCFWFGNTFALVVKPLLPRGCQAVCNRVPGCASCRYESLHLSCHVYNLSAGRETTFGPKNSTYPKDFGANRCPQDEIFSNLESECDQGLVSIPEVSKSGTSDQEVSSRLLIVPRIPSSAIKQFFCKNNSIKHYPLITRKIVAGVAYLPKIRKLYLMAKYPNEQFTSDLNGVAMELVGKRNIIANSLAADDRKICVFGISVYPKKDLFVFLFKKKILKKIAVLRGHVGGIAVDYNLSVIFVSFIQRCITTFTYKGKRRSVIFKGNVGHPLFYDQDANALYFVSTTVMSIYKFDTASNDTNCVKYVGFYLEKLAVREDVFYIQRCMRNSILMVLYANGTKLSFESGVKCPTNICFIQN